MESAVIKSRPILFTGPMVRALLGGSKTQTRRVVKKPNPEMYFAADMQGQMAMHCPYGQRFDQLWVRESIFLSKETDRHHYSATGLIGPGVDYEKEPPPAIGLPAKSIPSIHMPRWASRITLEITGVRVERLQDISATDAMAEGVVECNSNLRGLEPCMEWRYAYEDLWKSINGPSSWDANPWVWVVEFKRVLP